MVLGARTRFHVLARSSLSLSNGIWYKWKFLSEPTFVPEFRIHLVRLRGERITLCRRWRKDLPIKSRSVPFYLFIRHGTEYISRIIDDA